MASIVRHFVPEGLDVQNHPAVLCGSQSFSYAQIFHLASDAATVLQQKGIRAVDRVGLMSPNSPDYLIALLALWRIGAIACLFNTRSPIKLLDGQMKAVHCHFCLTYSGTTNVPEITTLDFSDIIPHHETSKKDMENDFRFRTDQDATIIFTSGSSTDPKAVLHTLGNHFYSAKGSNEHIPVVPGDQWLLSLPMYHVGGLSIFWRAFLGGGSVVIPEKDETIEGALARCAITHISLVPTQLIRLLRNKENIPRLKTLKAILLGGASIPDSLIDDSLQAGLPIYTTYGLTEMASQVATTGRLTPGKNRAAKILNYRKVMLSEENEILVIGETLFKGYVDHDKIIKPFNGNGYFATGDLGEFSDNGNLVVTGRKDNMFISGGENVHPEEIERLLCQIKGVEEAIIVPVAHHEFGFRPVAFIKTNQMMTSKDVLASLKDRLPGFKLPDQIYQWPEEEKEEGLKIDRRGLALLANERSAKEVLRKVF